MKENYKWAPHEKFTYKISRPASQLQEEDKHFLINQTDYLINCVFVDEPGFDINKKSSTARSTKGTAVTSV